jgi:hypothetical protein
MQPFGSFRHARWLFGVAVCIVMLLLFCAGAGVGIRSGVLAPPEINLTVRGIGLVAHTTNVPSCAIWFLPCQIQPLGQHRQMYAIWFVWRPAESAADQPGARRLIAMRIVP